MNNKRLLGILIILAGILILAVIIYMLFFYKNVPEPVVQEKAPVQTSQPAVLDAVNIPAEEKKTTPTPLPKREFSEIDLKILAASFAERFGSYSNQSDYGNIRDLKVFMSSKMSGWADNYIQAEISKHADTKTYYGITTKAIAENIKEFDLNNGTASVMVSTIRNESAGSAPSQSRIQQNILINFIKEGKDWKVDNAYWQDR